MLPVRKLLIGTMDQWTFGGSWGARGKRGVGRGGGAMEECQDTEIPAAISLRYMGLAFQVYARIWNKMRTVVNCYLFFEIYDQTRFTFFDKSVWTSLVAG